ncbi:glycosyltransferase family 2 protein [Roseibium sp. RKSG952]|uniref:glycosyltransferase family 2 protein n=1 Tax=Roseibium sp. RKSG952 TaxID=2529384 RepID=UPI0012BD76A5|nr:glycosyltransferase family 2 protein [Roseibium sp. RKSG952]MTH96766.1 glycosyltransferase family 2 protein [Roseibium sp. RKSG952]
MNEINLESQFLEIFDLDEIPDFRPDVGSVTAIVLCYNEILRLPHFLEHHRNIGIGRFLIVDNGSTDGTSEFLRAQPDVIHLPSTKEYKTHKARWRHVLASLYLEGQWVAFPDVDELLVYPGYPERRLPDLTAVWSRNDIRGAFSTMVDMYSDKPPSELAYTPGEPFLNVCPYFDAGGYRLLPVSRHTRQNFPTPPFQLYGGARERLFPVAGKRSRTWFDAWLEQAVFSPLAQRRPRFVRRLAIKHLKKSWPDDSASMGKLPLVVWSKDLEFGGGVHRINRIIPIAEDWVSLLHFKYLDDFVKKTQEAVARGQHAGGAAHYKRYSECAQCLVEGSLLSRVSRKFETVRDLEQAGLMRCSDQLRIALDLKDTEGGRK